MMAVPRIGLTSFYFIELDKKCGFRWVAQTGLFKTDLLESIPPVWPVAVEGRRNNALMWIVLAPLDACN